MLPLAEVLQDLDATPPLPDKEKLLPCDCWRLGILFMVNPFPKHLCLPPALPRGGHGA